MSIGNYVDVPPHSAASRCVDAAPASRIRGGRRPGSGQPLPAAVPPCTGATPSAGSRARRHDRFPGFSGSGGRGAVPAGPYRRGSLPVALTLTPW